MSDIVDRLLRLPEPQCSPCWEAAAEIASLRLAVRRLADQDATLSACNGNVTVTMDATLTDEERRVLCEARDIYADEDDAKCNEIAAVIDGLLERTNGC